MADYTSSEIQAAVEKVVRSSVRRPYGSLGNRDVATTFNDLQEATAGVFILNSNAPFYVVFLGAQRLLEAIDSELQTVTKLVEAIDNTGRLVKEIKSTASLSNAHAALEALETAAANRSQAFQSIESIPAFKRYDSNLQQFLDDASVNSRVHGAIVPTPAESREVLAGLVTDLSTQQTNLVSRATYLANAISDYDQMNLPSVLAQGVMARARQVLSERIDELNKLSPSARLGVIRDVTLDLLVGRAAVKGLGSLKQTTTFALIEGTASLFADTDHLASTALLFSDLPGPYAIWAGFSFLDFTADGSFTFSVAAPGSFVAFLGSSLLEPYEVTAFNNTLVIEVDHPTFVSTVTATLTIGTRTARQIATDINAAVGLEPIEAVARVAAIRTQTIANIDRPAIPVLPVSDFSFTLPVFPPNWDATGVKEGDYVEVIDPTSALFGTLLQIVPGGVFPGVILCNWVDGPFPGIISELSMEVRVGPGQTVRIQAAVGQELINLTDRIGIRFPSTALNTAVMPDSANLQLLGFVPGATTRSRSTNAEFIAGQVSTSFASQLNGKARLGTTVELVPFFTGLGRTSADDPAKLIAYKYRGRGDTLGGGPIGVVFTVLGADQLIAPGDTLVLRETTVLADINVKGLVTGVTSISITADLDTAISADTDILVEVGPTLVLPSQYLDLRVSNSASQDGDYTMDAHGQEFIPFEFVLEQSIALPRDQGGQPFFFNLQLGYKRVVFSSTNTTLSTSLRINTGSFSAAAQFFNTVPSTAIGSSKYFRLPIDPKSLEVGDTLELYETTAVLPSRSFDVTSLELSLLLIEVDPEIESTFGSIQMSETVQVPFARIRLNKKNNYELLKTGIEAWLTLNSSKPAWFTELNRRINPLLVNTNPAASDIGNARTYVLQLQADLMVLVNALTIYSVFPVDAITTLIETFQARGSDRGLDILLQGRFSDFFGLTLDGMSTGGHYRESLRSVQQNDLPISKIGRGNRPEIERTIAAVDGRDPDFDFSDVESPEEGIDIPGDFTEITPPGR